MNIYRQELPIVIPLKKSEWTDFSLAARSISRALEPPACTEKEIRLIRLITQKLLNQLNGNKLKIFMLYEKHVP